MTGHTLTISVEVTNPDDRDHFLRDVAQVLARYPRLEGTITCTCTLDYVGGGQPVDLTHVGNQLGESSALLARMIGE